MSRILQPRSKRMRLHVSFDNVWAACLILTPFIGLILSVGAFASQMITDQPCPAEGCKVVGSFATYGEIPILLAGIVLFALLVVNGIWCCFHGERIDRINKFLSCFDITPHRVVIILLASSFALEGYLVAVQYFAARAFCPFCMSVFAVIVLTAIFYEFYTRSMVIPLVSAVFIATFLGSVFVSPTRSDIISLPDLVESQIRKGSPSGTFYLIYGQDCSHCEDIIGYCKEFNGDIDVRLCPVEKSKPLLDALDIDSVPTMVINTPDHVEIIVGSSKIMERINSSINRSVLDYTLHNQSFLTEGDGICSKTSPCIN